MVESGVRIVYSQEAIGYHNHPVELDGYARRTEGTGRALVHLADKHPDHEGGLKVRDLAVRHYLMYSTIDLERDLALVRQIEPVVGVDRSYQDLWERIILRNGSPDGFTEAERQTANLADALFHAYNRILGFHWSKGYLSECFEAHGNERTERWLRARLSKGQASVPVRRMVQRRLGDHGLDFPMDSPADYRTSLVVHGLRDYASAIGYLAKYQDPPAAHCNIQVVLVIDPATFSTGERENLSEVVDVVVSSDPDEGVMEAVRRCSAEVIAVTSAFVEPVNPHAFLLAEKMFDRIPTLAVLGGSLADAGERRRYGYRLAGEPLVFGNGGLSGDRATELSPIEVAIPEFCILRRETVRQPFPADARTAAPARPWNFEICHLAAKRNQMVLHVPELEVCHTGRETPVAT
jgi:hypothetical protein